MGRATEAHGGNQKNESRACVIIVDHSIFNLYTYGVLMRKIIITILLTICLAGCGTMEKAVVQPDGSIKYIAIMRCRTFARDLHFKETTTTTQPNGNIIIKSIEYSSVGTTGDIIGKSAQLAGAVASMSPM